MHTNIITQRNISVSGDSTQTESEGQIMGILAIIGLIIAYNLYKAYIENKLDNYDHHKIDFVKLHEDKVSNHLSDLDLHRNIVNGKYDKK